MIYNHVVTQLNRIKYVVRCMISLPEHVGSGLMNDFINNLPLELQLAFGNHGINPLDEVTSEHDLVQSVQEHGRSKDCRQSAGQSIVRTAIWAKRKLCDNMGFCFLY